ncbi:MAG: VWA domain-containing protein, partial [Pseudomonadota bacterium]
VDEQKLAFWNYNEVVEEAFSFNLRIRSSYPLDDIRVPAQPHAVIQRESDQVWTLALNNAALTAENGEGQATPATVKAPAARLDQDVVVYWRHQAGLPAAIDMVSYRPQGASKGTFMMTITPGDDLGVITGGRDWVFVLDYSGSMVGKYQSLIEGVGEGLQRLNPQDRFRIVLFNQEAREITRGFVPAKPETVSRYVQQLEQIVPSGGTNLYAGLALGYTGLDADRPAAVILVSDGVANVGVTQKKNFLQLLERYDVRLYSVVMGNSANRPLLEGMAKVSNGFAVSVSNADDIAGLLMQTADKLSHEAYRDLELSIRGVKTGDLTPSPIGTLYRGQQLIILGHYWGDGQAELTLTGKVSSETKTYRSPLYFPESDELNPELERLWAYASIEQLQDQIDYLGEDADFKNAIIDLALEYGLVTDYTSMIVVRDEVFQQLGIDRKNTRRVERELAARQKRDTTATRTHRQDASQPAFENISGNNTRAYPSGRGGSLGPYTLLLLLLVLLLRRWLPQDLSASGAGAAYRADDVRRSTDSGHRDQA